MIVDSWDISANSPRILNMFKGEINSNIFENILGVVVYAHKNTNQQALFAEVTVFGNVGQS